MTKPMRIALTVTQGRIAPLFETARRLWLVTRERGEVRVRKVPLAGPTPADRVAQVLRSGADLVVTGGIARPFRYMLEGSGTAVMPWVTGPAEVLVRRLTGPRGATRRISVSAAAVRPDAEMCPCFGRAPFHGVFDPDTGGFEFIPAAADGKTAERLLSRGIATVATGSIGPIAAGVLRSGGVAILSARSGTLQEVVAAVSAGRLRPLDGDDRNFLAAAGTGARPGGRKRTVSAAPPRKRKTRTVRA